GLGGVLAHEMKALPGEVYGFVAGLGGVDVTYKDIERIYALAREGKQGWYPTEVK
ncbi:MAG: pyruvate ferredoxin oxidoreductase, partial [Thermoplasmata archaeon]